MKKAKLILMLIALVFSMTGYGAFAYAAEGLPPELVIKDELGNQAKYDGTYFIEKNDIEAGQTFKKTIAISNFSDKDTSYSVSMLFSEGDETHVKSKQGQVDLLEAITVKLSIDGKTLYEGKLTGKGRPDATRTPIELGKFSTGDMRNMLAEFSVRNDPNDNWEEVSEADFYWIFRSDETTKPSDSETTGSMTKGTSAQSNPLKPKLPSTGEDWRNVIIGIIAGLILVIFVLVLVKKRAKNKKQTGG